MPRREVELALTRLVLFVVPFLHGRQRPLYSGDDVHDNDQDARDRSASPIIAAFDGTGRTNDGRREKEEDEDENFDELATPAPEASRYGRRAVDHDDEDAQGGDDMGNGEGESDDEDARALISQGAQTLKHRTKGVRLLVSVQRVQQPD